MPDPFCLSREFPWLREGLRCPFTGDTAFSFDDLRAGTGRRKTDVGGNSRRAAEDVGEVIVS